MISRNAVRAGWIVVGLALVAVLIGLGVSDADGAERRVKSWHTRTIYVQETLPRGYDVGRAIEVWDNRTRLNLVLVKRCPRGKACITFEPGKRPTALASAYVWQDRDSIDRCVIVVDTRRLGKLSTRQRLGTLSHETGHCLGLAHTSDRHDVMYRYNTKERPWKPSANRYAALAATYGK